MLNIPYSSKGKNEGNLLIIDDEIDIIRALERQFRRKYNVFSTTNPVEGLEIMERENIQVVLSDQRMPGMTGVDFFTNIKDKFPDTLKLILTGYTDVESVIGAINDGQVFRYVKKPWNPDELDLVVREAFEKYGLVADNRKLLKELQEINTTLEDKVKDRTKELEMLNERLFELNREKNRYIGMVAHDLRNPISIAASYSDILIEDYDSIPRNDQFEYLGQINSSCYFSLDLIRDFLDTSKIEAGIFDLNVKQQDYIKCVRDAIRQNEFIARAKSQRISLECSLPEIQASFDANKIHQVLNNLLGNAIKYSHHTMQIKVLVEVVNDEVITKVIDQGQGIPENELPKLFIPFQTTSVKPTGNEKATGLGLAIVKKIIEAHHGAIFVESQVGVGSVFTFSFPIQIDRNIVENSIN